ncbi:alkaline phosphatase [Modestobacter sp. I12A-02628]|uniref:Alkaline phosphatase n=1 Tax=Goekera deserti TaxID=2497753 RepID=A0A7K3WDY6_9ACTN|nr:alkaline phosphatase [Goekera deserti]MPQ99627.1 alkaline phosphatase [Goekera deserti]NDI46363.1 alkaline phosphatase [Goekera deserti]NEL54705.1 alkaline phosphatase [Goekera deserti]
MRGRQWTAAVAIPIAGALAVVPTAAQGSDDTASSGTHETGNMIFIHPDGSDVAMWELARIYWYGPDAVSNWDQLEAAVPYRGHASDILTTSSNGGATTHAFGFKTDAPDSFGTDSGAEDVLAGDAEEPRTINALSGYAGSWLREAGNAGLPIGVVNDGDVAEPGTAAFLTEVTERSDASALEIARQLVQGRPGFDAADADPAVIMGGGEDLFFPTETPICSPEVIDAALAEDTAVPTIPLDCVVHRAPGDTLDEDGPSATGGLRTDGLNLAQAAADEGYTVIRTRAEFEALAAAIESGDVDPAEAKVLALFASQDIFNAVAEEQLIAAGLVDPSVPADAKETNLVLYGSEPGTPGYRPPTAPEMAAVATTVLDAHSEEAGKPFATVWEVEGTDNMANIDNASGTLLEARYADEMIGVARDFVEAEPATTVLTAADGTAGGIQASPYNVDEELPPAVESIPVNPGEELVTGGEEPEVPQNPLDGRYGRGTEPFLSAPDQFGQELPFGIAWTTTNDITGGVVTRAEGLNADLVDEVFSARFENNDVYRVAYLTLFGKALEYPEGEVAPTRPAPQGTTPGRPDEDVVTDVLSGYAG